MGKSYGSVLRLAQIKPTWPNAASIHQDDFAMAKNSHLCSLTFMITACIVHTDRKFMVGKGVFMHSLDPHIKQTKSIRLCLGKRRKEVVCLDS